jgi:hypothetical protein
MCAFSALFTDDAGDEARVPLEFLRTCERLNTASSARDSVEAFLDKWERDTPGPLSVDSDAGASRPFVTPGKIRTWADSRSMASSFSDDIKQMFVEDVVRTLLNPAFDNSEPGVAPTALVGRVQPERAEQVRGLRPRTPAPAAGF